MMTRRRVRILVVVAVLALAGLAAQAGAAEARAILQQVEMTRGVACVPRCGDGSLALQLAEQSEMLVFATDPDPANVAAARKRAAEAGLLGRRLYVEQGDPERLPFADHYVDLLVLDVSEKDLSAESRAEILRVLSPIRGRAVLADSIITKGELAGSDWWPAKLHGPNNNPVSEDEIFRFPPILQYRALPLYNASMGAALTIDGIHYEIHDWVQKTPVRANLCGRLTARSVYNGQILWDGFIPEGTIPTTPTLASSRHNLLFASGSRAEVVRKDLKTGQERPPIVLGDETRRIQWLACSDGILYALVGEEMKRAESFSFYGRWPREQWTERMLAGTELVAWDLASGRVRWRREEAAKIDSGSVAIHDGRLYYYAEESRLVCLDAKTGSPLWQNDDREWIDLLKRPARPHNYFVSNVSRMIVADGVIRLAVFECKDLLLFDASNGVLLSKVRGSTQKGFLLGGNAYFAVRGFDAQTGEPLPESLHSETGWAWCGLVSYAPGTGVLGHSTLGYKSPCATGAWVAGGMLVYSPTVCDCGGVPGTGTFASGGEVLQRIEEAPEHPFVRGPAFGRPPTSAESGEADWPSYRGGNLRRGCSDASLASPGKDIAWTATPPAPFAYSTLYNQYVLQFDERPTPAIVGGGRVFTAGSDGRVVALSLADGQELWTFQTDGPVLTPPALSGGRLYIPCGDGWVYAVDAGTGDLAWKRRVAPMERRILVFEQLLSNWPVLPLMVAEDKVYATAGHAVTDGGKAMALDAATGEILWSHFSAGVIQGSHQAPKSPAQGYGGHLATVGDRVWGAGHYSAPLVLDRATGEDPLLARKADLGCNPSGYYRYKLLYYTLGGQDVVVVDDSAVLVGGNRLFENHQVREGKRQRVGYKLYFVDEKGDWGTAVAPLRAIKVARIAPACDDELVVFAAPPPVTEKRGKLQPIRSANRATVGLNVWRKDCFLDAARAMQTGPVVDEQASRRGRTVFQKAYDPAVFRDFDHTGASWRKPELDINAVALARDAVLVAHADGETDLWTWQPGRLSKRDALIQYAGWKLTAFARGDGQELWSLDLPSEPLYNGLAVAADGSVLVTLRDGSVVAVR